MTVLKKQIENNRHPLAIKRLMTLLIILFLSIIAILISMMVGPVVFSLTDIWQGIVSTEDTMARRIVWELRVPRVLVGYLVGICLASAGAILQAVMKNPLADPGIIGVTSGAGLAATTIMILFPAQLLFLPSAAFLGAFCTAMIVYGLSWKGGASPVRIILVGVAINSILGAVMSAFMLLYSDRVQAVLPWLAGGIAGVGWVQFEMIIFYVLLALICLFFIIPHIRVLRLGDDVAKLLGHRVEKSRFILIALSALLAGIAVSVSGLIGFVGLVVPHIVRAMVGSDERFVLPISALGGGLLVVVADAIARSAFNPIELPVGILLSFLGGPFFLYLIHKRRDSIAHS